MRFLFLVVCAGAIAVGACGGIAASTPDGGGGSGSSGSGSSSGGSTSSGGGSGSGGTSSAGSSGSTGSSGGSGNGTAPAPDAFLALTMGAEPSTPRGTCILDGTQKLFTIGVATSPAPQRLRDGATAADGSPVKVACSVVPASGGAFDVSLSASLASPSGGTVAIASPPGAGAVTTSGGQSLHAVFTTVEVGTYQETDCTLSYTYLGAPVPDTPSIAAGRIWGHLSCPHAILQGGHTAGPDGGFVAEECDAEVDLLFENCAEQ
jgi:hypothetical protein